MVDTNLLLYAHDTREGLRHEVSRKLLTELVQSERFFVTTQILNEFFWNATRSKRNQPPVLSVADAVEVVHGWCEVVPVAPIGPETTLLAVSAVPKHGLSFWDALIWASARQSGVRTIYTEDYQHAREVEGVRYISPFKP